jgi:hypothetical protein
MIIEVHFWNDETEDWTGPSLMVTPDQILLIRDYDEQGASILQAGDRMHVHLSREYKADVINKVKAGGGLNGTGAVRS